tara:strand:+ start:745 stop:1569 length:825 start_codon:yes stop_codon:yes gene_type:complete
VVLLIYKDKVIITSAKRGTRLFGHEINEPHTRRLITYSCKEIYSWSESVRKNFFNGFGLQNTKVYLLNRNPIGHIASGLWNWFEVLSREDNFLGDYTDKFMYVTSTKHSPDVNNATSRLNEEISQLELLDILNRHIDWYNNNRERLVENCLHNDYHLNTDQLKIKLLTKYLNVEVVDIEKVPNLLQHLGFDYSDKFNNYHRSRFSQKQSKLFYSMFLEYMLTQKPQCIIDGFKNIYGKCSVVRGSSLHRIDKDIPLINHINNEVNLYEEMKSIL